MESLQVHRHIDEEGNEWVTMRLDDFERLLARVEEAEDLATFDAARESDEPLLSFDEAMAEIRPAP